MSKLKDYTRRFIPEDFNNIRLQEHEQRTLDMNIFLALSKLDNAEFRTCIYNNCMLGIGGYYTLWPGVIEIFIIPSIYIYDYPMIAYRVIKEGFEALKQAPIIHRMQTACLDDPVRTRFMENYGFTCEGTMRCYTKDKETYKLYSWVRED